MGYIDALKTLFLFLALSYTFSCFGALLYKIKVPAWRVNLMAIGWTGFIYLQWLM